MELTRRKFFGWGSAIAAAVAVPVTAEVIEAKRKSTAVAPILLERICDAGRSEMTAEDISNWEADMRSTFGKDLPKWFPGCGTRFQWYFGGGCPTCPNCGRCYLFTLGMLKSGKYNVTI